MNPPHWLGFNSICFASSSRRRRKSGEGGELGTCPPQWQPKLPVSFHLVVNTTHTTHTQTNRCASAIQTIRTKPNGKTVEVVSFGFSLKFISVDVGLRWVVVVVNAAHSPLLWLSIKFVDGFPLAFDCNPIFHSSFLIPHFPLFPQLH